MEEARVGDPIVLQRGGVDIVPYFVHLRISEVDA
jgi:hypothetical protein